MADAVSMRPFISKARIQSWDAVDTQEFCSGGGGIQQIRLTTEDRDLGAVAP